jgi:acyl-CoA thioester hydrolase
MVTPRFGDIDRLGHINNVVLAGWFELARNPLFRIFDPHLGILNLGLSHLGIAEGTWPLIMAHTEFDFIDQLFFQPDIELRTCIGRIGVKSFTVCHEAWQEGRLCTKGKAVMVYFDFQKNRSAPLPDDKKKLLAEHQSSTN